MPDGVRRVAATAIRRSGARELSPAVIARLRLRNQHLEGTPLETPDAVVRSLVAVQSQDYPGAKWAVAQRVVNTTDAEIDRLFDEGRILRTHVMRPTWHFVAADDIRWLLELTRPRVEVANAYQYRKLELDDAVFARTNRLLEEALGGQRFRTRKEIAALLEAAGIAASGLRLAYILMRAELEGLICSGPLRGKQFTYALLAERSPRAKALVRDEALAHFTLRYYTTRGPATAHDFSKWSGLTIAEVRAGLELVGDRLLSETVDGKTYWFAEAPASPGAGSPVHHLLPNYDELVSAYKEYGSSVRPHIQANYAAYYDALSAHFIAIDGIIVGGWTRALQPAKVVVSLNLLVPITVADHDAIEAELERYRRFLGLPVEVV